MPRPKSAAGRRINLLNNTELPEEELEQMIDQVQRLDTPQEFSGELKKVGRRTNLWQSRFYVLKEHHLLVYKSKGSDDPQHIIFVKGLFFEYIE